jgi:hypothetical protein
MSPGRIAQIPQLAHIHGRNPPASGIHLAAIPIASRAISGHNPGIST